MTTQQPTPDPAGRESIYDSSLSQYIPEDPENRRNARNGFLLGGLVGLLIGWFVFGWLLFPVRYEGGYPSQLVTDAQADYVSSVADAYVARQDAEALDLARYRLRAFLGEENLAATLAATQEYFAENPNVTDPDAYPLPVDFNSQARINNISLLGAALGAEAGADSGANIVIQSDEGVPADANAVEGQAEATSGVTTGAGAQPANDSGGGNLWRWLLILLAGLALLGGAVYLIRHLARRSDGAAAADTDTIQSNDKIIYPASSASQKYIGPPEEPFATTRPGEPAPRKAYDAVIYDDITDDIDDEFGEDLDDDFGQRRAGQESGRYAEDEEPPSTLAATVDPQAYAEYGFDEEAFDNIEGEYRAVHEQESVYQPSPPNWPDEVEAEDADGVRQSSAGTAKAAPPRVLSGSVLNTHELRYHAAAEGGDYDESFTIKDDSGRTVGACGMGVNLGQGTVKGQANQVIALDAWLFDKVNPQRPGDYRRILISEYVVDQQSERLYEGDPTVVGPPIVAQRGIEFRIEGEHLFLLCKILQADYSSRESGTPGVFTNVAVEMRVVRKD